MALFTINKDSGDLELEDEMVLAVPEFRRIGRRLKKCTDDSDGRKKTYNRCEMLYVFFIADWTRSNYLASESDDKRKKLAIVESGLSKFDSDYKPDGEVKAAIKKYIEIQQDLSPTVSTLIIAKRNLVEAGNLMQQIGKQNKSHAATLEKLNDQLEVEENIELKRKIVGDITIFSNSLKTNIQDLLGLVSSVTKSIEEVDKMEAKVREEFKENIKRIGRAAGGSREIPGYNIMPTG